MTDDVPGNEKGLKHSEVTDVILKTFYDVYNELGQGFLESVYQNAMALILRERGLQVEGGVPIGVWFRGAKVGDFEADLLVDGCVILELKAVRAIDKAHEAQLMNYLRATDIEIGFVLNFGPKPEFRRLAYDNSRKARRPTFADPTP